MHKLLVEELKQHEAHVAYIANKEDNGISHYYISHDFPLLSGFDSAITKRIWDLEAKLGLKSGHPIAYCKLKLLADSSIYMGVYFADIGERFVILEPSDFPKLPKDEDKE